MGRYDAIMTRTDYNKIRGYIYDGLTVALIPYHNYTRCAIIPLPSCMYTMRPEGFRFLMYIRPDLFDENYPPEYMRELIGDYLKKEKARPTEDRITMSPNFYERGGLF